MEQLIENICSKVGIDTYRTKHIAKHISYSFLYKVGSVLANFLLVPLAINYLDTDKFGIWLTLSSVITWFSFFDLGLGNGLRNKFAEAKAKGKEHLAQSYVSSAYFTIGSIVLVLFGIFLIINPFINWAVLFNGDSSLQQELGILIPVVFAFFCMRLVVKLITSIYLADQHHSILNKIEFFTQAGSLACIWLLTQAGDSSLLLFGTIYSALPVAILLLFNIVAFSKSYERFRPKMSLWKKEYLNDIVGLGFRFFIAQMGALILFSTDNFIISKLFSPAEVVPYNIAYKYFSIVTMAFGIMMTPYWSSFTEAYTKEDFEWIKKSVSNLQKIWLGIPMGLLVMVFLSDWFYQFWIGEKIKVPFFLTLSMAFYVSVFTLSMIYNYFINGVGKIKLHMIISIISIFINIPLSIFFAKYLNLNLAGIILGTCVSLIINLIFMPIQYYKLLNNKASGIWNE